MSLAETLHLLVQPLSSLSVWFIQLIILQLYEYYLNLHWLCILFCRINVSTIGLTQLMSPNNMAISWLILSPSPIWTNLTSISSRFLRYVYNGLKSIIFYSLSYVFTSWIFSPFRVQSFLCSRRIVLSLMSNSKICHLNGDAKIWTFAWRLWPLTFKQGVNIVV